MSLPCTFGGTAIFGVANHAVHRPAGRARQADSFFGVSGVSLLDGGDRGRMFEVHGVLIDPYNVAPWETLLLSYDDGVARVFTDTQGRSWPNMVLLGESYAPNPMGPRPAGDQGWILEFHVSLKGLQ